MFQNLYKQNSNKCDRQEVRRKNLLQQQKLKRLKEQDARRHCEETHHYGGKEKNNKKVITANVKHIHLQLSEWFKEKPENLDDWLLVPCPKGQRCLVVTENGKTKMFSKNKRCRMTFPSLIPGGGVIGSNNENCILDCIYCQEKSTFYVLDALHFFIPLVNCEAEFRFFWLKSKFRELDDLEEKCKYDDMKTFKLLDNYDASDEACLAIALQRYPLWQDNQPELDGFLFYHKKSHYAFGTTPLVCWLFPFMLPDILQITVSDVYKPPFNYCKQNPWHYMDEFDEELTRKRNRKINKNDSVLNTPAMEGVETIDEHLDANTNHKDNLLESLLIAEKILELEENCS